MNKIIFVGILLVVAAGLGWWVFGREKEKPVVFEAKDSVFVGPIEIGKGVTLALDNCTLLPSHMPSGGTGGQVGEDKVWDGPVKKTSAKTKPTPLPLYRPLVEQPLEQEVVSEPIEGLPDVKGRA